MVFRICLHPVIDKLQNVQNSQCCATISRLNNDKIGSASSDSYKIIDIPPLASTSQYNMPQASKETGVNENCNGGMDCFELNEHYFGLNLNKKKSNAALKEKIPAVATSKKWQNY